MRQEQGKQADLNTPGPKCLDHVWTQQALQLSDQAFPACASMPSTKRMLLLFPIQQTPGLSPSFPACACCIEFSGVSPHGFR